MTELLTLNWWVGLAAALVVVGAGLVLAGLDVVRQGGRRWRAGGREGALVYLYAFRRVVVGLALVGAGVALVEQVGWLLAASVCIGIGELLESSYYIGVLHWGRRRLRVPSP
jgi:hypothetical protein